MCLQTQTQFSAKGLFTLCVCELTPDRDYFYGAGIAENVLHPVKFAVRYKIGTLHRHPPRALE